MMTKITWRLVEKDSWTGPATALVAPCWKGRRSLPPATRELDRRLGGAIRSLLDRGAFRPERGAVESIPLPGGERVLVVGLGDPGDFCEETIRAAAGRAARAARAGKAERMVLAPDSLLPTRGRSPDPATTAACIAEAVHLALYRFDRFKSRNEKKGSADLRQVRLVVPSGETAAVRRGVRRGRSIAEGTILARDLVNLPANEATPEKIAAAARALGRRRKVRVKVIGPAEAERLGMGSFLSVARGSANPPRFVVVDAPAPGRALGTVVLVGKTVTFDSGGLSLKQGKTMEQMKGDMGGGAAVLGAIDALCGMKIPVRLIGLLPAVENMPSGTATRPGDIVRSLSGLTVEILNTDAEGRLILADALSYAGRFDPDVVIDIATLTGACMVAVGPHRAGLFTADAELENLLIRAGDAVGEKLWPLPMDREYDDLVRSDVADVKNISSGREGGATVAAVFLRKFVPENVRWAHLDIAGREFLSEERPYAGKGATGFGTRLLARFVEEWAAKRK